MDDGLAEKLYDAFWDPLVARGWPRPCTWRELHETQRQAWEQVAIAARSDAASKVNGEVVMLRGANDAWQREDLEARKARNLIARELDRIDGEHSSSLVECARRASQLLERIEAAKPDEDAFALPVGFSASLGLIVKTGHGVTPNDSVVANRKLDDGGE